MPASKSEPKIGRPSIIEDKKRDLAKVLWKIGNDQTFKVTAYMKDKLKKAGYVTVEVEEARGPGRRREGLVLTGKAQALINLAKGWGVDLAA